ncbi:MaoC/PaaZ C-terminal domain-containing protein [Chelatococcus reniformis]|uniref:MaoC-like dehydratase n=1 Tax=Chelatococcus reniformis TaxID=1494448 RepID=A0A916UPW9_9HYPH|nr:MaoC/PaaZ C-terminal domain-containing protein [Chelatococcus reniformis]GGC82454.1 MaoC-like dehydratase [Chelatococcus reniformis]
MSESVQATAEGLVGKRIIEERFGPITRHTLALYCGASGDHNPIHVDSDFAKAFGFPDVFSHGMLVMSRLGRALTNVVPQAAVRSYTVRFVAITQVGAEITAEGEVTGIVEEGGERRARIALIAKDQNGEVKLQGEATAGLDGWEKAHG